MTWESQTASGPMGFVQVPEMQFLDSEHYKKNETQRAETVLPRLPVRFGCQEKKRCVF